MKKTALPNELKGRIAYLSEATKTVGLLLEPVTEPDAKCLAFDETEAKIVGAVIGKIGGSGKTFTLGYEQSGSTQTWRHFEGED